jgi:hypothetical protein
VAIGQPYAEFWRLTLREVVLISTAISRREKGRVERERLLNQELAHLVAYAYHNPKEMPDLTREARAREMTPEQRGAADLRAALLGFQARNSRCRQ